MVTSAGNTEQYEAWNNDSGRRWALQADRRDRVLAPVAAVELTAARLGAGERVLDIGSGCGATTLAAADAVGPDGTVIGIDLSGPMLDVARRRQQAAGVTNVTFVHGDAQTHRFPQTFDVAISRFGTMFFADPVAAFVTIGSCLGTDGRLALATWQSLAANDWMTIPARALLRYGTTPDVDHDGPGPFAQAEPDRVERVLAAAGYTGVDLTPVRLDLTVGADVDDAVDYVTGAGVCRSILASVAEHERLTALDAVRAALTDHVDDDGVHLGAAIWIVTAVHP